MTRDSRLSLRLPASMIADLLTDDQDLAQECYISISREGMNNVLHMLQGTCRACCPNLSDNVSLES
jgi:hypothetical protein